MTLKDFGECFEFNINHNIKHAILGLGAPGVGKSQIIKQIGEKYGYKVIDIRLAQMSEVEIGGLIYPNESKTKTVWLSPEILPDEERDGKNTILLLDEITSCSKRVQVAAYQLILDRRIGQYHLPEGTFVVALGNTEDDDGVYIQLAGPLADRFEIHYIQPDFDSWKNDFALKNDVHQWVIDYLSFKPSALHNQVPGSDYMIFATPRSWVRVSDILKINNNIDDKVVRNKIIGNVGNEGRQFIEFCKRQGYFTSADAFMKGNKPAPEESSELSMLVFGLVNKVSFLKDIDNMDDLDEKSEVLVEQVIAALMRIPQADFVVVGLKGLLEMNRSIVKNIFFGMDNGDITKFVNDNKNVLGLE
jgi:hypothetical protein